MLHIKILPIINLLRIQVVVCHTVPCDFLPACAGLAVIAVGVDGDAAARGEFAPDFDIFRIHQANEILHDDVHAVLMEITVVAETEQVQLDRKSVV